MPARTLRCIGGPSNNRHIEVPGGVEEINVINPIAEPTPELVKVGSFKATQYVVRAMRTPDGEIEFLSPASWSTYQALCLALR